VALGLSRDSTPYGRVAVGGRDLAIGGG